MSNTTFKTDYAFGKSKEPIILEKIKKFFKDDTIVEMDNYSRYDYKGNKKIFELKSRRNTYNAFPTTLIPADKIFDTCDKQYFLFDFTDRLTYIEFDKEVFSKFECKPFKRNYRSDFNDKEKNYFFIPITHLKTITV